MILYWLGLAYEQQALQAKREAVKAKEAARQWEAEAKYREADKRFELARKKFEEARSAAVAEARDVGKLLPDPTILAALGHLHAVSGNRTEAQRILRQLEDLRSKRYVSPVALAVLNTGLGDHAAALQNLKTAYDDGSPELTLLKIEPRFDPLRTEPQFIEIENEVFPP